MPDPFSAPVARVKAEAELLNRLPQDFVQRHNAGMLRSLYFEAIGANQVAAQLAAWALAAATVQELERHVQAGNNERIDRVELLRRIGQPLKVANAGLHAVYSARLVLGSADSKAQTAAMLDHLTELVATTPAAQDTPDLSRQRQFALARIAIERARRASSGTPQGRLEQLLPGAQQAGGIASFLTLTALASAYNDAQEELQNDPNAQVALQIKVHETLEQAAAHTAAVGPATPELLLFYQLRGYFLRLRNVPPLITEKHFQTEQAWIAQLLGADSAARSQSALNYCNLSPDSSDPGFAERAYAACDVALNRDFPLAHRIPNGSH